MPSTIKYSEALAAEYSDLFSTCQTIATRVSAVEQIAGKVLAARARYEQVGSATAVPWYVIAAIHNLEGSLNFKTHLHNGDPLTARTRNVPAGRPKQGDPPFQWEDSAVDALKHDKLAGQTDWILPRALFRLERYNGLGYRHFHPGVLSPYLWSFSNHYVKGKYGSDSKFDPELVSAQCGAAVLLKHLEAAGHISIPR